MNTLENDMIDSMSDTLDLGIGGGPTKRAGVPGFDSHLSSTDSRSGLGQRGGGIWASFQRKGTESRRQYFSLISVTLDYK